MPVQDGNHIPRPSFWTGHCNRRILAPSHETSDPHLADKVPTPPGKRASLAPAAQAPTRDHAVASANTRLVGLTLSPSNEHSNDDQPLATTKGAYNESLTRLQKGYLMVISNLESHNKALQQEMDNVLSRHRHEEARRDENAQNYGDLAKQYSHLQQHHDNMYEEMKKELDSISHANTVLQGMAVMNVGNHQTIQERDEKIKLLQSTVFGFGDTHQRLTADLEVEKRRVENLEAANRRLAADLEAERRKDETIRTQSATIMAKTLKLIQVEEVHRRLQAALKEERRKNGTSKNETINNETTRNKTIKEEDDMAKDTDERINKKNATIRDKNSQINQLKDAKQKLEEALKAERRKNRHMGKMSAAGVAGAHTRATAAMKRQSENTRGPAHKKVKHVESTSEDAHHPHVVE